MFRRFAVLFAVLSSGCVPVTEPVGDIDKAEPDKALVGSWAPADMPDTAVTKIELAPEVKGNPKGLMRMHFLADKGDDPVWFFVATAGKGKYGNTCMDAGNGDNPNARLGTGGEYAKWAKSTGRRYFVFHYTADKDGIVLNFGDEAAVKAVMKDEKIEADDKMCFKTPPGWLAKYLEKNSRDAIFPAAKDRKFVKAK